MVTLRRVLVAALFVFVAGSSGLPARAQSLVHGFVDPCTLANYEETDRACELCRTTHSAPNACQDRLAKQGFVKRCRAHPDHEGFSEVWCTVPAKAPAPSFFKKHRDKFTTLAAVALLVGAALYFRRFWASDRPAR
jgi:hypothetical protein